MDDKKDNIVSKGTMKVTSYYEYEIKRKENNKKHLIKKKLKKWKKVLDKSVEKIYNLPCQCDWGLCLGGEIGRRTGLKILW